MKVYLRCIVLMCLQFSALSLMGQRFSLVQENDSLSFVVLEGGEYVDRWQLPYEVYRFCMGDIDGNGTDEALVGVVKSTRFYPSPARRIFVFKNHRGHIRPMWLGSKLGGELVDFRLNGNRVRSFERAPDGSYFVAEYQWRSFGLKFEHYVVKAETKEKAKEIFNQ